MENDEIENIRKKMAEELLSGTNAKTTKPSGPIDLTDSTFVNFVKSPKVTMVDFWAPWCAPCRFVSPVVDELSRQYSTVANFGKVNVDENPMVSSTFRIQSIPTIMFFKNGKAVDASIGAVPKALLERKLKALIQ
ncbi:MAG: thioredoxin [Candidatus Thermoplasmatota archaeon]|jgi:thioredoxin 1|nr:thioredoxin [Candidatus Thermoplasmatota archaeon]